jgi:hypothetical protein
MIAYTAYQYWDGPISTVITTLSILEFTYTTEEAAARTIWLPTQCDGTPRVSIDYGDPLDNHIITFSTPVTVTEVSATFTITIYSQLSIPSPTCSINPSDCQNLATAIDSGYSDASQSWAQSNVLTLSLASPPVSVVVNGQTTVIPAGSPYTMTIHNSTYPPLGPTNPTYFITDAWSVTPDNRLLTPGGELTAEWDTVGPYRWIFDLPCRLPGTASPTCTASQCFIIPNWIQMSYFAPPPTTRDLCANTSPGYNRFAVSDYSQPHSSTVIDGTLFWSDSVYMQFDELIAATVCWNHEAWYSDLIVGSIIDNPLISLPSSSVSSLCARTTGLLDGFIFSTGVAYPFNFYDLQGPVPASAWACGTASDPYDPDFAPLTITEDFLFYIPVLSVPSQVLSLVPEWSDCLVVEAGHYDPPTALAQAPALLPTTTETNTGPGPTPGKTPTQPNPVSTPAASATATNQGLPPPGSGPSNPNPSNPGSSNPDPSNPDPSNPNPSNPDPANPDPSNPDSSNPDPSNPDPSNPSDLPNPPDPQHASSSPFGGAQTTTTPLGAFEMQRWSSVVSSAISSVRGKAGQGSVVIIDPDNQSTLQTLTTGEIIGPSSQTVVAFDPGSGLLVVSGTAGVTKFNLPSLVLGVASKTTVIIVPMSLLTVTSGLVTGTAAEVVTGSLTSPGQPANSQSGDQDGNQSSNQNGNQNSNGVPPQSTTKKKGAGSEIKVPLRVLMLLAALVCLILSS